MKVSVNDKVIFEINETKKKVIKDNVHADIFDSDMERRLEWIIMHKYDECFKELKAEWEPKLLKNGVKSFPADPDEFAELVFSQPNYKCCKMRGAIVSPAA